MILPTKFENERIMFTIDYGDMLPWGSVVELAKITVEVSSGDDPVPQRVFSQTWDIDGTIVTYQVRRGVPGVIYRLLTAVMVAGDWVYKEVKLAVIPDHGDVGSLYPLTRVFTSLPYVQQLVDSVEHSINPIQGYIVQLLFESNSQPSNVDQLLEVIGGDLKDPPLGDAEDLLDQLLEASSGVLTNPISGRVVDTLDLVLTSDTGTLKIPPIGEQAPDEINDALSCDAGTIVTISGGGVLWDPTAKGSSVSLASGDSDATKSGSTYQSVYGDVGKSSGAWQFELKVVGLPAGGANGPMLGLADKTNSSNIINGQLAVSGGTSKESLARYDTTYRKDLTGDTSTISGLSTVALNDVITITVDLSIPEIKLYKNGTIFVTTTLPSGKTWYPAASIRRASVVRLVSSSLQYPQSGFTNWG